LLLLLGRTGIETLEGAIKAYGAPIVSKVQDVAPKVLSDVDKRVDTVVGQASTVYDKYTNTENIQAFKKSREEYLKQIEQLLDDIKAKGIQGSVKLAADNLTTTVNDVKNYAQSNLNMKDLQKTLFAKVSTNPLAFSLWDRIGSRLKKFYDKALEQTIIFQASTFFRCVNTHTSSL
jgi:hypothetical protein